jgi:hypothetical protein
MKDLDECVDKPIQKIIASPEWKLHRGHWNMRSLTHLTTLGKHQRKVESAAISAASQGASHVLSHIAPAHASGIAIAGGLSLGGIGAVFAPWIMAAKIAATYRHDINRNDLHDVSPQCEHQLSPFPCNGTCKRDESNMTECELAIKWLINRNETDLAVFGLSVLLAGIPSMATKVYRTARKGYKKLSFKSADGKSYPTPASDAVWQPDSSECKGCGAILASAMAVHQRDAKSRHHCRLCGENYCSECCYRKVAVLQPLVKGGREKELKEGCLVCDSCIDTAIQNQKELSSFASAPMRRANILKANATPTLTLGGCKRAQAAIYAIYNGDITATMFAIIASDGAEDIVRKLEM